MTVSQGTTFPAMCTLLAQWAPPEEKGKLFTTVYAGNNYARSRAAENPHGPCRRRREGQVV